MADGWSRKDGKDRFLRRLRGLRRARRVYGARTMVVGTSTRTAAENIIAIRDNAKKGRDILGVVEEERKKGQQIWRKATAEFMRSGDPAVLDAAARAIGDLIVAAYQNHIKQGAGAEGEFTPVKESTAKRKKRETGREGLPPMYRTGELMRAFVSKVVDGS